MKLYFSPGACSLAPHIALEELGLAYQVEQVDIKTKKTKSGEDFFKINPKGYVPALQTNNGDILTEGAVILQYLADQKPEKNLLPKLGTFERVRTQEWLNYIATELHKSFGPLFSVAHFTSNVDAQNEMKEKVKQSIGKKFDYLSEHLNKNQYLMGSQFTVADMYLFTILNWHKWVGLDLTKWPKLMGFLETVKSRPAVAQVLKNEGL